MKTIKELGDIIVRIEGEQNAIFKKCKDEGDRDLTSAEFLELDKLNKDFEATQGQLAILQAAEDNARFATATRGRTVPASVSSPPNGKVKQQQAEAGYRRSGSFGRFAQAVAKRGQEAWHDAKVESQFGAARMQLGTVDGDGNPIKIDAAAASTFASEALDSEGALLIPPDYSTNVTTALTAPDSLLSLTNPVPVMGNGMVFPVDETTPWGTAGIQAYWQAEGTAVTASKPLGEPRAMRLKKLMCLVPVTNELLEDAAALETWITRSVASRFNWKIADAIVNGTGVGMPLGFAAAASLISAAGGANTANTIKAGDVTAMYSNMIPEAVSQSYWLVSPTGWAQLPSMVIGQMPVWQPDFRVSPGGVLFGRPVIVSMTCQALGTAGDIYFAALGAGYASIIKAGGVGQAISAHLYFDADQSAFRFTFRMDGMPWLKAAPTVAKGTAKIGHFVNLGATTRA